MCWAFDKVPSELPEVYWSVTFEDLKTKLRLKIGYEHSRSLQEYQTLALILSKALGGKSKERGAGPPPNVKPIQNAQEAQVKFAALMSMARGSR